MQGLSIGSVSVLKLNQALPPSILADSNGDLGSDWMPARIRMITNGQLTQTSIITTVIMAVFCEAPHCMPYRPNRFRNFSMMPTEEDSINCQMIVPMTGATISGKISATRRMRENRLLMPPAASRCQGPGAFPPAWTRMRTGA